MIDRTRAIISIQSQCFSSKQFHSKRSILIVAYIIVEFRPRGKGTRRVSDDSRAAGFLRFFHARPDDVVPTKLKLKWLGVAGQKSKYRHEKKCSFAKAGEGDVVPANDPLDPFEQSTSVALLFWKMHDRMSNNMHNVCLRYEQRIGGKKKTR